MDDSIELEKMFATLDENPHVKGIKKSLSPIHGKYCDCGKCNKWGYVRKSDEEILRTEKHIQQWKNDLLKKLRILHYKKIQIAERNALKIKEMIGKPVGLDAWF